MSISDNIKKIRKDNNLTQREFAEKINKKEITVRRYESGDITPPINVIDEISKRFNVPRTEIIKEDDSILPAETTDSIEEVLKIFGEDEELRKELSSEQIKINDSIDTLLKQVGYSARQLSRAELKQLEKSLIEYLKTIVYIKDNQ